MRCNIFGHILISRFEGKKVKKIVAFVGTNKEDSVIAKYISNLIEIIKKDEEVSFKLFSVYNNEIKMCCGCLQCYNFQQCPLDCIDDMAKIKNDFLNSDLIILGSPVYLHNVSGGMKNFLDRLSYWTHIFPLRGKNSVVITSTSCSGSRQVSDYLEKMLNYMGCPVIQKVHLYGFNKYIDTDFRVHALKIYERLKIPLESNQIVENHFANMKKIMLQLKTMGEDNEEITYWNKHCFFENGTIKEIVERGL